MGSLVMATNVVLSHELVGPASGPAVVLLHGFPLDRSMWRFQVSALTKAGCRVLLPDLRGSGKSPTNPESSIPAMTADVLDLMDRVSMRTAAVVGFSMGGYVALHMAVMAPERVSSLVLMDTRAEPDTPDAREKRLAYVPAIRKDGPGILLEAMLGVLLSPESHRNRRGLVDLVKSIMARQSVEGLAATLQALADRPDQRANLSRITCPTLIVAGQEDVVTPPQSQGVLASGIKGSELVLLPRLAHASALEGPDAVNRVLLDFFARQGLVQSTA